MSATKSPLRVLVVLPDPPLPFGNAAARWFYVLLRGLLARGHRVTALVACAGEEEAAAVRAGFAAEGADVRCFVATPRGGVRAKWDTLRRPRSYIYPPALVAELESELRRGFDVLHLEQHWSGWLGLEHARRALVNVHYLYEIDTAELSFPRWPDRLRHRAVIRAERALLRRYPRISTVTDRLQREVERVNPAARVTTVPLGLDLALYPFREGDPDGDGPVLGLIGTFSWQPTYAAGVRLLTRLWPAVRDRVPGARLRVVGRDARRALAPFLDGSGAEVHEDVPDILPHFRALHAMLYAPGRGSGLKVKVQEAFALGVPVVTTRDGAEGLPAEDGVHAGIAESDEALVDRTVALLRDPALRRARRGAARELVARHCDPAATVEAVERIHRELAHPGPVRPRPGRS